MRCANPLTASKALEHKARTNFHPPQSHQTSIILALDPVSCIEMAADFGLCQAAACTASAVVFTTSGSQILGERFGVCFTMVMIFVRSHVRNKIKTSSGYNNVPTTTILCFATSGILPGFNILHGNFSGTKSKQSKERKGKKKNKKKKKEEQDLLVPEAECHQ